jgi:hypothetical protein
MGVSTVIFGANASAAVSVDAIPEVIALQMKDDSDQGAALPAGAVHGDAFVVNNWGVGVYVGIAAGINFANGDIAERRDDLGGFVRLLAAADVVTGIKAVVIGAGAAGSFVGQENDHIEYDGAAFVVTAVADGDAVRITGDEGVFREQSFQYNLATTTWVVMGTSSLRFTNTVFADPGADNDVADGSVERPYATVTAALAAAPAGGTIMCSPGVFAETVNVTKNINIEEIVPGTVTIQNAVVGGGVFVMTGANPLTVRLNASVVNTSNATAADLGIDVDADNADMDLRVKAALISGGAAGTAINVAGDVGGANDVAIRIEADTITGGVVFDGQMVTDLLRINNAEFTGGAGAWITITGTAGRVILSNSILAAAAAGETLDYGNAAACGVDLDIGSCAFAAFLNLNNDGGTGGVVMTAGTQLGGIVVSFYQVVQKWLGEDELIITAYGIDANAVAATAIFQVPGGRRLSPHTVRTVNRGGVTGVLLNYRVNGTGAGTIVALVGAGALAQGIANEAVLQDSIAPAGFLEFDITAGSGTPGDLVDCEVTARLF